MILRAVPKTTVRKPRIVRRSDVQSLDMGTLEDFGEPTTNPPDEANHPDPVEPADDAAESAMTEPEGEALLNQLDELRQQVLQTARQEADQLVATARTRAIRTLEDAKKEADQIRERAYQEAYQKGSAEGFAEASANASEQFNRLEQTLSRLAQQMREDKQHALEQIEQRCLAFSLALAEKVVEREIATQPDAILPLVKQGIRTLHDSQRLTIWLSAEDITLLREQRQSLLEQFDHLEQIDLRVDDNLQHGECLLDSDLGLVDATFQERWRLARQLLMQLDSER